MQRALDLVLRPLVGPEAQQICAPVLVDHFLLVRGGGLDDLSQQEVEARVLEVELDVVDRPASSELEPDGVRSRAYGLRV